MCEWWLRRSRLPVSHVLLRVRRSVVLLVTLCRRLLLLQAEIEPWASGGRWSLSGLNLLLPCHCLVRIVVLLVRASLGMRRQRLYAHVGMLRSHHPRRSRWRGDGSLLLVYHGRLLRCGAVKVGHLRLNLLSASWRIIGHWSCVLRLVVAVVQAVNALLWGMLLLWHGSDMIVVIAVRCA